MSDKIKQTKEIINIYPEMFKDANFSKGFQVGTGWFPIIKDLVDSIKENDNVYNQKNNFKFVTKVSNISERFGSMVFQVGRTLRANVLLVNNAEQESYLTCETCGTKEDMGSYKEKACCKLCAEKRTPKGTLYTEHWSPYPDTI